MALGYEGLGLIDGTPFLCTGMGVPQQRNRMDSNSAFRGSADSEIEPTEAISPPHTYDWPTNDGTISWDTTSDLLTVIKDWIFDRTAPKEMEFYPCRGARQKFLECYWTSIGFEASEGANVTGSCNFIAMNRDEEEIGNEYITNRLGLLEDNVAGHGPEALCDIMRALNPAANNTDPLPFWKGTITCPELLIGTSAEITQWSVTFTQEITKNFVCTGTSLDPLEPEFLGIGPMVVELQMELYITAATYNLPYDISSLIINVGDGAFNFSEVELQQHDEPLKVGSDLITIATTYSLYGLTAA